MREIDTNALELVAPSLGVGNPATVTSQALFDDETLQQALVVNQLAMRSRSIDYTAALVNNHVGDGLLTQTIDFYNLTPGIDARLSYPTPDDMKKLDVWLVGPISGNVEKTTGTISAARLVVVTPTAQNYIGGETQLPLAYFTKVTATGGSDLLTTLNDELITFPHAFRVTRGSSVRWTSTAAGVTVLTQGWVRFGLMLVPRGTMPDRLV